MKSLWEKPRYGLASPAIWTLAFGLLLVAAGIFLRVRSSEMEGIFLGIVAVGAVLYLSIGIGAWQEKRWAVSTGFWFFAVAAGLRIVSLFLNFSWGKIGSGILFLWLALEYRNVARRMRTHEGESSAGEEYDDEERPLISFVLLERSPRLLDEKILEKIVEDAWGGDYSSGDDDAQDGFVVGEGSNFVIKTPVGFFMIHNLPHPYFDDTEAVAEEIGELRLRQAVLDHQAWIAVDLLTSFDPEESPDSFYPEIVRLILELADEESSLVILRPDTGQINLWNDEVFETLIRPEGEAKFNQVNAEAPVLRIEEDDPLMVKAVEEARRRWPDFVEAFGKRAKSDHFAVKAPITVDDTTEFIWISVTGFDSEYVYGELGNEPVALEGLHLGSTVEAPLAEMNDWSYMLGDEELVGLFTVKAIEAAQERQREELDQ